MYLHKKSILLLLSALLFASSCNNSTQNAQHEEDEHAREEAVTIAVLTPQQMEAVGIKLGKVEQKSLTATLKTNGLLVVPNSHKGNATSLYGGIVRSLNVQLGDRVSKGQVIATLANPQFIQAQEEYLTIGNRIALAEQELTRQKTLSEGNAGSLKNLQNATAELNNLLTRRASLQQQIRLMGINPDRLSNANLQPTVAIVSPISGVVSGIFAKIGSYAEASQPVAEVVDNNSLHLDLQVFEKDLPLLKTGQTVRFQPTNNPTAEYEATVFSIGSSFEGESKTIAVHCRVTGNIAGLMDGMNITAIVSLSQQTTPAVPSEAIVNSEGKDYIFIATDRRPEEHHENEKEDEKADENEHGEKLFFERVEVVKGISNLGYTAVSFLQELPENTPIVTRGAFFINAKLTNTGEHEH